MHSKSKKLFALGAVLTASVALTGVVASANSAVVTKDGQSQQLFLLTNGDTQEILNSAGIETKQGDLVVRSTNGSGRIEVSVRTAYPVRLVADGKTRSVTIHYGDTAADVLEKAQITLGPVDTVNVALNRPILEGETLRVTRNRIVTVTADGVSREVVVDCGARAEDIAWAAGVNLTGYDELNVDRDATLEDGEELVVRRVSYRDSAKMEDVPYDTETVEDDTLEVGTTEVETEGQNGQALVISRTKYIDGEAVSTEERSRETITEPVTEVVREGTKEPEPEPAPEPAETDDAAQADASAPVQDDAAQTIAGYSYSRVITGECTAYSGGGICSTGVPAAVGRVAVDPNEIPYGTRMYVTSDDGSYVYGYCVAADTGGFIYTSDTVLDLYMNTESECISFGRRDMLIYILD